MIKDYRNKAVECENIKKIKKNKNLYLLNWVNKYNDNDLQKELKEYQNNL